MPPQSASKQKRLAEKAAKQAAKQKGAASSTATSTPTGSVNGGSSVNTPLTSRSAAGSTEDLNAMEKLKLATERYTDFFHRSSSQVTIGSQECRWCLGLRRERSRYQDGPIHTLLPWPTFDRRSRGFLELRPTVWSSWGERFRKGTISA